MRTFGDELHFLLRQKDLGGKGAFFAVAAEIAAVSLDNRVDAYQPETMPFSLRGPETAVLLPVLMTVSTVERSVSSSSRYLEMADKSPAAA